MQVRKYGAHETHQQSVAVLSQYIPHVRVHVCVRSVRATCSGRYAHVDQRTVRACVLSARALCVHREPAHARVQASEGLSSR